MKVATFSPISLQDVGSEEEWFRSFLERYNVHGEEITRALQANLTTADNLNTEARELQLTHDVEAIIELQRLRGRPSQLVLTYSAYYDYCRLKWRLLDQRRVAVQVKWDTPPSKPVDVKLLVFGS